MCLNSVGYDNGSLNSDFQILRKRICRYSPRRLWKEGYISHRNMILKYGRNNSTKNFSFSYFKVETSEVNGVLHILYRGSYLPYNFLVDNWQDIHLSWELNIKNIDLNDCRNAACYVVSQYIGVKQGSAYVRSSQSYDWVFRGFKSMWYKLKSDYAYVGKRFGIRRLDLDKLNDCFVYWDNILRNHANSFFYPQVQLTDFG